MNKPMNKMNNMVIDSWILFKRCLLISIRNPESLIMATITPFFLMLLFGTVFGSMANVGDFNYIDFIVPGIIMQSIANSSQHSAMNVTKDMTSGIIDRFRSMSISKSSILMGHTGAGVVKNIISTLVIFGTALLLGFSPKGGLVEWLIVIGLLVLVNIAISLVAVMCGLVAKTPEGSSGLMFPLFILPFISSGFAPVDTMPSSIRWFAMRQPMTPIIDSIRALTLDLPVGDSLQIALVWCTFIIILAYIASIQIYKRKVS